MTMRKQIEDYLASHPEPKRADLLALHRLVLEALPGCRLWFLDGKDEKGKVVSNPNVGYGLQTMRYADGKTKDFYQIGLSPNTTGVSVYILGLEDKKYLAREFGSKIGKATVTGYCIKFKALKDVDVGVLKSAIQSGAALSSPASG